MRRCYCGGASLPPEVDRFFAERGLPILCGYGLTEASPVITATTPGDYRSGTVGRPLAGVEVRLADDGEVHVRGPNVMQGYWQRRGGDGPRAATTAGCSTGDLGEWDAAGHLRIVGRKKEMIVLATGKKVAPTQVEQLLAGSPLDRAGVRRGRRPEVPGGADRAQRRRAAARDQAAAAVGLVAAAGARRIRRCVALYREEIDRCLSGAGRVRAGRRVHAPRPGVLRWTAAR